MSEGMPKIGGTVLQADGAPLPGATVEATYLPNGFHFRAVSSGDGSYLIQVDPPGGGYSVTGTLPGFKPDTVNNIAVKAGETTEVNLLLTIAG